MRGTEAARSNGYDVTAGVHSSASYYVWCSTTVTCFSVREQSAHTAEYSHIADMR